MTRRRRRRKVGVSSKDVDLQVILKNKSFIKVYKETSPYFIQMSFSRLSYFFLVQYSLCCPLLVFPSAHTFCVFEH